MATMARLMDARVCGLKRRSALPWLVGETWPITTGSEHELANDQIWAHSGKCLQSDESKCEKKGGSCVRMLVVVLWCRYGLNIGDAWCCDRCRLLLPAKTKTDPQPEPYKHGEGGRRVLTVHRCKAFQFIGSAHRGHTREETYVWGNWKPPTKSVGGVPWLLRTTHCMNVVGQSWEGRMDGCDRVWDKVGDQRYLKW